MRTLFNVWGIYLSVLRFVFFSLLFRLVNWCANEIYIRFAMENMWLMSTIVVFMWHVKIVKLIEIYWNRRRSFGGKDLWIINGRWRYLNTDLLTCWSGTCGIISDIINNTETEFGLNLSRKKNRINFFSTFSSKHDQSFSRIFGDYRFNRLCPSLDRSHKSQIFFNRTKLLNFVKQGICTNEYFYQTFAI